MNYKIFIQRNRFAVMIDEQKQLAPLADHIDKQDGFRTEEYRYNIRSKQGTIIVSTNSNNLTACRLLEKIVQTYCDENK